MGITGTIGALGGLGSIAGGLYGLFGGGGPGSVPPPAGFNMPNMGPAAGGAFQGIQNLPGTQLPNQFLPWATSATTGALGSPFPGIAAGMGENAAFNQYGLGNTLAGAGAGLIPGMTGLMNAGFDPQGALYQRTLQQVQDQTRAGEAARGIATTPYGAGLENQAVSNFNIDWQNQQLQREIAAAQGAGNLYGAAEQGIAAGANLAGSAPGALVAASQLPFATGVGDISSLFSLGTGGQGLAQPQIADYLNYLGAGTAQQGANTGAYSAYTNALYNQARLNQSYGQGIGKGLSQLGGVPSSYGWGAPNPYFAPSGNLPGMASFPQAGGLTTPPGFAEGGAPPVGEPIIVGEQGPEVFVPQQPGQVVPNHQLQTRAPYPSASGKIAGGLLQEFLDYVSGIPQRAIESSEDMRTGGPSQYRPGPMLEAAAPAVGGMAARGAASIPAAIGRTMGTTGDVADIAALGSLAPGSGSEAQAGNDAAFHWTDPDSERTARLHEIDQQIELEATRKTKSAAGTQKARVDSLTAEKKSLLDARLQEQRDAFERWQDEQRKAGEEAAAQKQRETSLFDRVPGTRAGMAVGAPIASYIGGKYIGRRMKSPYSAMIPGATMGAIEGAGASLGPTEIDLQTLPRGSVSRQQTQEDLRDPNYWARVAAQTAYSGGAGAAGGFKGSMSRRPVIQPRKAPARRSSGQAGSGTSRARKSKPKDE